MSKKRDIVERRYRVFQLVCQEKTQQEIASELRISQASVSSDIKALQKHSYDSISNLARELLPYAYDRCLSSIRLAEREAWILFRETKSEKIKLQCLEFIKSCESEAYSVTRGGPGVLSMSRIREEIQELRQQAEQWKRHTSLVG
jgi:hypothetical protein